VEGLESEIAARLKEINERIERARALSPFPSRRVQLVAVSKRQPTERVSALFAAAEGLPIVLGENYVQEWAEKRTLLPAPAEIHLIGPLQSNKAREAVVLFDVIESVHSSKLLALLSKEAARIGKVQRIFLQVNVSGDIAKSGFAPDEMPEIFSGARVLPGVSVEGLMTITREYDTPEGAREDFRAMRMLRETLDPQLELSMGMSSDFDVAIQEGATLVRVGSALFGARS
jgi:pyridoxal phosphate enzyme (YggS family)